MSVGSRLAGRSSDMRKGTLAVSGTETYNLCQL